MYNVVALAIESDELFRFNVELLVVELPTYNVPPDDVNVPVFDMLSRIVNVPDDSEIAPVQVSFELIVAVPPDIFNVPFEVKARIVSDVIVPFECSKIPVVVVLPKLIVPFDIFVPDCVWNLLPPNIFRMLFDLDIVNLALFVVSPFDIVNVLAFVLSPMLTVPPVIAEALVDRDKVSVFVRFNVPT